MPIQDRFTSENPYILTALQQTADNNQTALKSALDETLGVAASAVIFQQTGLNGTIGAPVPTAAAAANQTIGDALSGAGSTPDTPPCFVGDTLIWKADGTQKMIQDIEVGKDMVKCFDKHGNIFAAKVTDKWIHEVDGFLRVWFGDKFTDVTANHRYWTGMGFQAIGELDSAMFYNEGMVRAAITKKEPIQSHSLVYNITVELYHTYFADGCAVSNLKPLDDGFGGFE